MHSLRIRNISTLCVLIPVLFFIPKCNAQESTSAPDSKMLAKINELANVQKNLSKLNTPGTELRAEEVLRTENQGSRIVRYEFFAKNLPHDQHYLLGILRINQELQMDEHPKTLDSDGKVMDGPNDPFDLLAMAARGEPYRIQLSTKDGKYKTFVSMVPFPIVGSDHGCSLETTLLLPDAEAVLLQGKGFQPNSAIHVAIDSEGEKHDGNVSADKDGVWSSVLLPYKKGLPKGETKVVATSSACHPDVKFTWGKDTYHVE